MSKELDVLPDGWKLSTIGDLCEPSQYGYTAKAGSDGNYNFLRTTDITKTNLDWANVPFCYIEEEEEAQKYILQDGDIVISRAGSIGFSKLIQKPTKSVFASYLIRFRPLIDQKYLSYYLLTPTYWQAISDGSSGIAVQNVNAKTLSKITVPVAPVNEQTRIVEKLEELLSDLDNGVDELKAAQVKLTQYRQSLLKSAVEGSLTTEWRAQNQPEESGAQLLQRILIERRQRWEEKKLAEFEAKGKKPPKNWQTKYPEPVQPDASDLPELPEEWVWASVDQLALDKRYGSSSKTNDDSSGVPVLRMGNIQDGQLDYGNLKFLPSNHKEFPVLLLNDGDLLFNRTNSAELVGKTAVYKDIGKPCSYASYLISVTFTDSYKPELAAYFINSVLGKSWLATVMNQTAGQANVNGTKLGELAIPVPPIDEQGVIVEQMTSLRDDIQMQLNTVDTGIKQSEAQRKNILKDAFSGKLVEQDPADEPASVLLEKIQAERAERAKQPKPKRTLRKKVTMNKATLESVRHWVSTQSDSFTFEQLSELFNADYEAVKEIVFTLLKEDEPIIEQEFNNDRQCITFIKVNR